MDNVTPLAAAFGLVGSAIIGALTYSFRAGATHKEVMLKLGFVTQLIERIEKRLDYLERDK